jgi:hypothetical protein
VIAHRELGGAAAWATIATSSGIGSLIGGLLILRRPVRRPLLVGMLVVLLSVVPWILLGVLAPVGVIAAGALLAGAGVMVFNALWEAALQSHIPAESLSRVSAYDWLGSLALGPLGAALVGPIAVALGTRSTLLLYAALATAVNVVVLTLPGVRHTENPVSVPPHA